MTEIRRDAGPPIATDLPRRDDPRRDDPRRRRAAWIVAMAADFLQIVLLPATIGGFLSPVSHIIDVTVAIALTLLLGWHWAFLPTFLAELVPFVDLVPTWTLAAFIATRRRQT